MRGVLIGIIKPHGGAEQFLQAFDPSAFFDR